MISRTLVFLLLLCIMAGHAQVGNLDNNFSGDGKLMTPIGNGNDLAYGVAVQGNNRIVAVGVSRQGGNDDFAIIRYMEDGTLDNSFSGDGILTIDFDGGNDEARDVMILPDGKILVGGTARIGSDFDFAFAMLDSEGNLVTSFDGDGLSTYDFSNTNDALTRIEIYKDRIYGIGSSIVNDLEQYAIVALKMSGAPETAFSQDGMLVFDVDAGQDVATGIAVQPDDKILVAGYTGIGFEKEFCVVRFKPDGSLDNSFSSDGIVIPDVGTIDDRAYGIALQADQKIIVGGSSYTDTGYDFALIRLLPDGNLDLDFGEDGYAVETIGPFFDDARDMILQPDDKILITGYAAQAATDADFGLARFTADGTLDNTFSQDGKVITVMGSGESEDEAHAIALQPDGKIVIVGEAQNNSNNLDFAVARYLSGLTTSIAEEVFTIDQLTLFPNPTQTSLQVDFYIPEEQLLEFSIADLSGKQVEIIQKKRHYLAGSHTLTLQLPASLPTGAYILNVTNASRRSGGYKFLVNR
ncbi:MAG TPA: T9SS type A sorting domain-containing protein [Saprospiraceae bacterium]|nr:T9SS type A sorting domain-containing protein [Saprospiraceae bacterium]HQW26502.1 T9SS type A sorting domain-containing protein [Saprospiraceae bacterium]